jgi:TolA-binding protein
MVKAHQLLALLYLQEEKLEQAKKELRSAGKIDANNTITLRYLKEVNAKIRQKGSLRKKKEEDLISYQSGNETIIMPTRFQDYSLGATLGYLLIGLIIGALAIGFLVVPGVKDKAKQEMKEQMMQANETLNANVQQIESQTQQIAQLEAQIAELQGHTDPIPEQTAAYETLLAGYAAFAGNDFVTAGANLEAVDTAQLSASALEIYNTLWAPVSEQYFKALFDTGYNSYKAENYPDAIANLRRVADKDMAYKDGSAAYYLAQSYRKNGEIEAARPYYQYVVDNYPGTQQAKTAKNYINAN